VNRGALALRQSGVTSRARRSMCYLQSPAGPVGGYETKLHISAEFHHLKPHRMVIIDRRATDVVAES
jgi:hypothetical protein